MFLSLGGDFLVAELYKSADATRKAMMNMAMKKPAELTSDSNAEAEKKIATSLIRKLGKAEYTLGDFVRIGHGFHIPKKRRFYTLNSFDFGHYFSGPFAKYAPFEQLQYIHRGDFEHRNVDEAFFHGKRVLVCRYEQDVKMPWLSVLKANLAEESFYQGKEYLNLVVTDDRLSPEYVAALINSSLMRKWYKEQRNNGNFAENRQVVSYDLKRIPIVLPSDDDLLLVNSMVREQVRIAKEHSVERELFLGSIPSKYDFLESYLRKNGATADVFFNALAEKANFSEQIDFNEIEEDWVAINSRYYRQVRATRPKLDLVFPKIYSLDKDTTDFFFGMNRKINAVPVKR